MTLGYDAVRALSALTGPVVPGQQVRPFIVNCPGWESRVVAALNRADGPLDEDTIVRVVSKVTTSDRGLQIPLVGSHINWLRIVAETILALPAAP